MDAGLPKKFGIVLVAAAGAVIGAGAGADGGAADLANEKKDEAAGFAGSAGAGATEGNGTVDGLEEADAGFETAGGLTAAGFATGAPAGAPSEKGLDEDGPSILFADGTICTGGTALIKPKPMGFFSGDPTSCLTFSLSFAMAAASKSCFSHFEYVFAFLMRVGVSGAGAPAPKLSFLRPVYPDWNGLTR